MPLPHVFKVEAKLLLQEMPAAQVTSVGPGI
jgi:hypothetical protein